jgi:hypothetical protein
VRTILLEFDFSDKDLADLIANSTPPKGVKVGKPAVFIQASSSSGGVFVQLAIEFVHDGKDVFLGLLSAWIYDRLKKSDKKGSRINNQQIVFNKCNIVSVIKNALSNQGGRKPKRRTNPS